MQPLIISVTYCIIHRKKPCYAVCQRRCEIPKDRLTPKDLKPESIVNGVNKLRDRRNGTQLRGTRVPQNWICGKGSSRNVKSISTYAPDLRGLESLVNHKVVMIKKLWPIDLHELQKGV